VATVWPEERDRSYFRALVDGECDADLERLLHTLPRSSLTSSDPSPRSSRCTSTGSSRRTTARLRAPGRASGRRRFGLAALHLGVPPGLHRRLTPAPDLGEGPAVASSWSSSCSC